MRQMPLISVVVPVFNIEANVRKCLESLASQTYRNYEVLMVDDGSTDCSASICEEFERRFSNMRLLRKSNGGLSDARNYGIEHANGGLISLVDGDDYVTDTFLEVLLDAMQAAGSDIAVCSYALDQDGGLDTFPCSEEVLDGIDAMKRTIAEQRLIDVVAWNKLYRRELFAGNSYPVGRLHEDVFTTYRLFGSAKSVSYVDIPAYRYVVRSGSIMGSMSQKRLEVLDAEAEMREFCQHKGVPADKEIAAFHCTMRATLLSWIAMSPERNRFRDSYGNISKDLSVVECLSNPYVGLTQTAIAVIGKCGPRVLNRAITLHRRFAGRHQ